MSAQADYIVPQVLVFQEFRTTAAATQAFLHAFVFGENYGLFRYSDAEEKLLIGLGDYDRTSDTAYTWPNRPVNSEIDQNWTRVFFDNAWLRYAEYDSTGYTINPVVGKPNHIRADTINFATYTDGATTYPRDAGLLNRDVQVGDGVLITTSDSREICTRVIELVHDTVPSVVNAPTTDVNNAATIAAQSETVTQTSGTPGDINVTADGSSYDGSGAGHLTETYTVTCVDGGAFGVARLSIVSASGSDDVIDPITPADGVAIAIGTRGLTATFSTGTGTFVAGDQWTIEVEQAWTINVLTSGGTYTGANDGTYVVTVTKGGVWADNPEVFVSSTGTLDNSGPYVGSDGGTITLPTGVELTFDAGASSTGLVLGDRYYVEVEAQGLGPIRTLALSNSLPQDLFAPPDDLSIDLAIVKNIEVPRTRTTLLANWTTTDAEITLKSGIVSKDESWFLNNGDLPDLPVIKGSIYTQYRALLLQYTDSVYEVESIDEVADLLGPIVPENPLAFGVYNAKLNSDEVSVKFTGTKGTGLADYLDVLEVIYEREDVYGLVPLTHDKQIQDAVLAHCNEQSTADRGRWRVCWFAATLEEESPVLQLDDNDDLLLATILDDPDTTSVVDVVRLRCDEALFITNGVKGGDVVRTQYIVDPNTGEEVYEEYVVDRVLTEEELILVSGPSAPITVASRFEVWHPNTKDEMATQVAKQAGAFGDKRAHVVFPDQITNAGQTFDGMFGAAAAAGLRSGVNPHQGLTNVELTGFDDVSRSTTFFRGRQLDVMAASGVWIITQDPDSGLIFTRHQLTTDMSDLLFREDSMVSNFDSISYFFLRFFRNARYIGRRNITPDLIAQLTVDFDAQLEVLRFNTNVAGLGAQITDGRILSLERHPTLKDRIVANIELDLPAPFNVFELHLIAQTA